MAALTLNLSSLYEQGMDFLLQQAANWARLPVRLQRVAAARGIVEQAALQRNNLATLAKARALREGIGQAQKLYDASAGKVADVLDVVQNLRPGQLPPVSLAPKAAEVAAVVTAVTKGVTALEGQVVAAGRTVLTPEELQRLQQGGLTFPSFLGGQLQTILKYVVFAIPIYFLFLRRGRGTQRW